MNDYIIIGGGITGLYALDVLNQKNNYNILLCDERNYLGGRVVTHKQPHYEIGGARFNDNHVLTQKLIKKYKLSIIPINSNKTYIYKNNHNNVKYFHNANQTLDIIIKNIIQTSKKYNKSFLQTFTLKEFIDYISKSTQLSKKIKDIFGYYSEIYEMNAYDSLISLENDFIDQNFYIIKEGYSELCNRIYLNYYKNKNIQIKKKTKIIDIIKQDNHYKVITSNHKHFLGKKIIIAVKSQQLFQFNILKPIFPYVNSVYNAALLRIYAKYPKKNNKIWFEQFPVISTNSFLRQIIPIDYKSGLIMISYTDGKDIIPFYKNTTKKELKDNKTITSMIQKELNILFPELDIPYPTYLKTHLWEVGAHHWKKNKDSTLIYNKIKQPLPNIHIVGEAFSKKQAWVEGGLETVQENLKEIIH